MSDLPKTRADAFKTKVIAANVRIRSTAEGRARRNALEREALRKRDDLREKAALRQKRWQSTSEGKEKNRAKTARWMERKRLAEHYDVFLSRLETEGAEA